MQKSEKMIIWFNWGLWAQFYATCGNYPCWQPGRREFRRILKSYENAINCNMNDTWLWGPRSGPLAPNMSKNSCHHITLIWKSSESAQSHDLYIYVIHFHTCLTCWGLAAGPGFQNWKNMELVWNECDNHMILHLQIISTFISYHSFNIWGWRLRPETRSHVCSYSW